jgi:MFS family permease
MGSFGVALARTVPQLMLFCVSQAFGGGGGMSVGTGVISDIYRLEQRGGAMGVFFAVSAYPQAVLTWCRMFSCLINVFILF